MKSPLIFIASALLLISNLSVAESTVRPSSVGMSAERLERIDDIVATYVDEKRVAGLVTMVSRHGKLVHLGVGGQLGIDNPEPMQADSLFRVYSMTKAITAVAALVLYEEGHFHLNDPVEKFIPEFKNLKVYEDGELIEPSSKMTIHQLFTHMSGLSYGWLPGIDIEGMPSRQEISAAGDSDSFIELVAQLPLVYQPGEGWRYSYASDVLGIVVERIAGQPLGEFFQDRLFTPLEMIDTAFEVPEEKLSRLTSNHNWNKEEKRLDLVSGLPFKTPYRVSPFDAGGHGLVSTAGDYLNFLEMLRAGGKFGKHQILSPKTIKYMMKDHLPRSITDANVGPNHDPMLGLGGGHGLGIGVYIDPIRRGVLSSQGEVDWGGAAGTVYWLDPQEDVIVIGMSQLFNRPWRFRDDLSVAVYASMLESLE